METKNGGETPRPEGNSCICLDVRQPEPQKNVCVVCGHSNPQSVSICEMCSNYLFLQ